MLENLTSRNRPEIGLPPTGYGVETDAALALVWKKKGLRDINMVLTPSSVLEKVNNFFHNETGILTVPEGTYEKDREYPMLQRSIANDVITQSISKISEGGIKYLDEVYGKENVGFNTRILVEYNPFSGEISDFARKSLDSTNKRAEKELAKWVAGRSGKDFIIMFGNGGQISSLSFDVHEHQKMSGHDFTSNGLTLEHLKIMTVIAKYNYDHYQEYKIGSRRFYIETPRVNIFWNAFDKIYSQLPVSKS
jgi:hypothetical protein